MRPLAIAITVTVLAMQAVSGQEKPADLKEEEYLPAIQAFWKKVADDPDSMEIADVVRQYRLKDKDGVATMLETRTRGKNALGAKVLADVYYIVRDKKVVGCPNVQHWQAGNWGGWTFEDGTKPKTALQELLEMKPLVPDDPRAVPIINQERAKREAKEKADAERRLKEEEEAKKLEAETPEERKKRLEAKRKADEEAARLLAEETAKKNELTAAAKLKIAKKFSDPATYTKKLREIVEMFPDTAAAKEARTLLKLK